MITLTTKGHTIAMMIIAEDELKELKSAKREVEELAFEYVRSGTDERLHDRFMKSLERYENIARQYKATAEVVNTLLQAYERETGVWLSTDAL